MGHTIYKNKSGTRVPSVTTILGVLDKPALKFWANKIGLQGIAVIQYVDDKAMIGTIAHYIIECHNTNTKPDFTTLDCDNEQIEQAKVCVQKYFEWESYQAEFKPIANELKLVSESKGYGGTIDCIATLNGKVTLIDYKTCNGIYDEPYFQTAAYKELAKEHGYDIEQVVILRIGRDEDEGFEYIEVPNKVHDLCYQIFIDCLNLFNYKKMFTKAMKEFKKVA